MTLTACYLSGRRELLSQIEVTNYAFHVEAALPAGQMRTAVSFSDSPIRKVAQNVLRHEVVKTFGLVLWFHRPKRSTIFANCDRTFSRFALKRRPAYSGSLFLPATSPVFPMITAKFAELGQF